MARRNRDILRGNRWWDLYSIRTPPPTFQRQDFLNRCLCISVFGVDICIRACCRINFFTAVTEGISLYQITVGFGCHQPLPAYHFFDSNSWDHAYRFSASCIICGGVAWRYGIPPHNNISRDTDGFHESHTLLEWIRPLFTFALRLTFVRFCCRYLSRRSRSRGF